MQNRCWWPRMNSCPWLIAGLSRSILQFVFRHHFKLFAGPNDGGDAAHGHKIGEAVGGDAYRAAFAVEVPSSGVCRVPHQQFAMVGIGHDRQISPTLPAKAHTRAFAAPAAMGFKTLPRPSALDGEDMASMTVSVTKTRLSLHTIEATNCSRGRLTSTALAGGCRGQYLLPQRIIGRVVNGAVSTCRSCASVFGKVFHAPPAAVQCGNGAVIGSPFTITRS